MKTESLTKREQLAAMAMQGLLANPESATDIKVFASDCITIADELLKQLAEKKKGSL